MKEVYDLKSQVKTLQKIVATLPSDMRWEISEHYPTLLPRIQIKISTYSPLCLLHNRNGLDITMSVTTIKDADHLDIPLDMPGEYNQIIVYFDHSDVPMDTVYPGSNMIICYSLNEAYITQANPEHRWQRTELKPSRVREFILWCINTPEITVHWQ
jgi:hypothetical protein